METKTPSAVPVRDLHVDRTRAIHFLETRLITLRTIAGVLDNGKPFEPGWVASAVEAIRQIAVDTTTEIPATSVLAFDVGVLGEVRAALDDLVRRLPEVSDSPTDRHGRFHAGGLAKSAVNLLSGLRVRLVAQARGAT